MSGEENGSRNGFVSIPPDQRLIKPTRWLFQDWIPRGGLSLLVGNEEVGKGFYAVHQMARLTLGALPGCYKHKPIRVEIVAYEDSIAEWNKRMDAAGADPEMWSMLGREDGTVFNFREHLPSLIDHWRRERVKFAYIDNLMDHVGITTDSYSNKQMREALVPIHHAAETARITVMATIHPNKRGDTVRERVNGSVATLAVVRSAIYIGKHPDDEDSRVVMSVKNSRGPKPKPQEFEIVDTPRSYRPGGRYVKTGVIDGLYTSSITWEDLRLNRGDTKKDELDRKIRKLLSDGKWHWESDLREELGGVGYKVMKRAAKRIGVYIELVDYPARNRWRLPHAGARAHTKERAGAGVLLEI